jgi:hypothetical protein
MVKSSATAEFQIPVDPIVTSAKVLDPITLVILKVALIVVGPLIFSRDCPSMFVPDAIINPPVTSYLPKAEPVIVPPFIVSVPVTAYVSAERLFHVQPELITMLEKIFVPLILFSFKFPLRVVVPTTVKVPAPKTEVPGAIVRLPPILKTPEADPVIVPLVSITFPLMV